MIRNGMWVMLDSDRPAIAIAVNSATQTIGELHLVDDKGDTVLVVPNVPFARVKQARRAQIPAPRRPEIERASPLGYV